MARCSGQRQRRQKVVLCFHSTPTEIVRFPPLRSPLRSALSFRSQGALCLMRFCCARVCFVLNFMQCRVQPSALHSKTCPTASSECGLSEFLCVLRVCSCACVCCVCLQRDCARSKRKNAVRTDERAENRPQNAAQQRVGYTHSLQ